MEQDGGKDKGLFRAPGNGSRENSLFSCIDGGFAGGQDGDDGGAAASRPGPAAPRQSVPAPPAPPASSPPPPDAWRAPVTELSSRLAGLEGGGKEVRAALAALASEVAALKAASVRNAEVLNAVGAAVAAVKDDLLAVSGSLGEERLRVESEFRAMAERETSREAALSSLQRDLARLAEEIAAVSFRGRSAEKSLSDLSAGSFDIRGKLGGLDSLSRRMAKFEEELISARGTDEKCAYLSGRVESVEKRVSDLCGAHDGGAARLAGICGKLGEIQARLDNMSVLFGYFRETAAGQRRLLAIEGGATEPPSHKPDPELRRLIDGIS